MLSERKARDLLKRWSLAEAKRLPKHPKSKRRLVSSRPEKRPQTIMEQYRYREMMRQPHNQSGLLSRFHLPMRGIGTMDSLYLTGTSPVIR